ncbi:surface-adhesin E family protein [Brevundimonas sp. NPDC090276]|uniref:surface-adhesin E family protein n=1 Tax=Brevundimonas sp. NPDC090276 TaxID=3363956 RepID=UPI00383B96FA
MKIMTCAVAASMLLAGAAQAGEWRIIGADQATATFLDTSTIRIPAQGAKKTAWLAHGLAATDAQGIDYFMTQIEFDCAAMTLAEQSVHAYSLAGQVVESSTTRKPAEPVIPDTRGQQMHRAVCDGTDVAASERVTEVLALYRQILAEDD